MRYFESNLDLERQISDAIGRMKYLVSYVRGFQHLDVVHGEEKLERLEFKNDLKIVSALLDRIDLEMQAAEAEYDAFMCDKIAHDEGRAIEAKFGWNPNDVSPF